MYLLEFLRDRLGRTPVPDVGIRLEELMLRLRRSPGTSMSTWASQVRETYKRVQVALSRAREETKKPVIPISGGAREPEGPTSPGKKSSSHNSPTRRASDATQEEPQAESVFTERAEEEDDVDLEHHAMDPGIQGTSNWRCRKGRYDRDDDDSDSAAALADLQVWDKYEQGLEEVLPSEVLRWLLLRRANLPSAARLSIQAAAGNSLQF